MINDTTSEGGTVEVFCVEFACSMLYYVINWVKWHND